MCRSAVLSPAETHAHGLACWSVSNARKRCILGSDRRSILDLLNHFDFDAGPSPTSRQRARTGCSIMSLSCARSPLDHTKRERNSRGNAPDTINRAIHECARASPYWQNPKPSRIRSSIYRSIVACGFSTQQPRLHLHAI